MASVLARQRLRHFGGPDHSTTGFILIHVLQLLLKQPYNLSISDSNTSEKEQGKGECRWCLLGLTAQQNLYLNHDAPSSNTVLTTEAVLMTFI